MLDLLYLINNGNDLIFLLIRTAIIYIFAVLLFRFGSSRFRLQTPFDYVVVVIIGAILGRTIYGGSSLIATLLSSVLIIILHEILATLSYKSEFFGFLVKGAAKTLIKNGQIDWAAMKANNITKHDLQEVCRRELNTDDLTKINKAILERDGEITLIN